MKNPSNYLGIAVFGIVMLSWLVFLIALLIHKGQYQTVKKTYNKSARLGIILVTIAAVLIFSVHRPFYKPIIHHSIFLTSVIDIFIIVIAVGSVLLEICAMRTLGKQWNIKAVIVEDHKLVTTGAYGIVRNPIYLGMFCKFLAIGLIICKLWALIPALILFLVGTYIRIQAEEKILSETFGEEFENYKKKVRAFIPFIY
jgi:protein-S-isoprenylcysteine O-methyltransferase Ste14